MIIYLNKENLVINPFVAYAENEIKEIIVDDLAGEKTNTFPTGMAWQYNEEIDDFTLVPILTDNILRWRRQEECFNLVDNKSQLWWNRLTAQQLKELNEWYDAWLNVTKTKSIPKLPEVLKK